MGRERLGDVRDEPIRVARAVRGRDDPRDDALAEVVVGQPEDRSLVDGGMGEQRVLDLAGAGR